MRFLLVPRFFFPSPVPRLGPSIPARGAVAGPHGRGAAGCRRADPPVAQAGLVWHVHADDRAPRRRGQCAARETGARRRHARGPRLGHARRRRPERDRPGAVPGVGRAAHRGAPRGAPLRRRGAVLHARRRFRLLVQRGGVDREVGHDEIVGDFVRHIRATRPDVIVGFLCSGTGGGQHHQAVARLTNEAFRAAADPNRFPEQIKEGLRPWQAARVFCTDISSFAGGGAARRRALRVSPDGLRSACSAAPTANSGSRRAACTSARARRSCSCCPARQQSRVYKLTDTVLGPPGRGPEGSVRRHRHVARRGSRGSPVRNRPRR